MARYGKPQSPDVFDELYRRGDVHSQKILALERRKHLGVWINPDFLNGWNNAGGTYHLLQYRKVFGDSLEFRGTIQGGASGTVVFILLESHRPLADISFLTDIFDIVTNTFQIARVFINSVNGEITVSWATV